MADNHRIIANGPWMSAATWDANGIPTDDVTGNQVITSVADKTVGLEGVNHAGFANGIGTVRPDASLTLTHDDSADTYWKQRTDKRIEAPVADGEMLISLGTDLNNGISAARTITFDIDPTTAGGWLYQNSATLNRRIRAEIYDAPGWQKRWARATSITWAALNTFDVELDEVPAIFAVGRRVQFIREFNNIFDTTIAAINGNTVTLSHDLSVFLFNQGLVDTWLRWGIYLVDVESNIIIESSRTQSDAGLISNGLVNGALCCEIRGFGNAFKSGNAAHAHDISLYGVAHNCSVIFWENGDSCQMAGTFVGGGKTLVASGASTGFLTYMVVSRKGHIIGVDKDKSAFINIRNINDRALGAVASQISGNGNRSLGGSFLSCQDIIESDNSADPKFRTDTGLERMYVTKMRVNHASGRYALDTSRRVLKTGWPDRIQELDVRYSYPVIKPVVDEPDGFLRIDKLTFHDAIQTTFGDLRDVIDYSGKDNLRGSNIMGVLARDVSILLTETGTPTLYDYWLEKGSGNGRVLKGVTGTPLAGIPAGMTNPSKFEFFAGNPDLFEEKEVWLEAGQRVTIAWDVHLVDALDVPPFLYIAPWEQRSDVFPIDRHTALDRQPVDGYSGSQAANNTGVTQNMIYVFTATRTGLHQVAVHAFAGFGAQTLGATKTMWLDQFAIEKFDTVEDIATAPQIREELGIGGASFAADFLDAASAINTTRKAANKSRFDSTSGRPVYATGPAAGDPWNYHDGTLAYTPV